MQNYAQAMQELNKQIEVVVPRFYTGKLESISSQTQFGCIVTDDGEEIMVEGSTYGVKLGDRVAFEIRYAHKFKRATDIHNINGILEEYHYSRNVFSDRNEDSGKKRTSLALEMVLELLKFTPKPINLSPNAKRALAQINGN